MTTKLQLINIIIIITIWATNSIVKQTHILSHSLSSSTSTSYTEFQQLSTERRQTSNAYKQTYKQNHADVWQRIATSSATTLPFKMGPIGYPETSKSNRQIHAV